MKKFILILFTLLFASVFAQAQLSGERTVPSDDYPDFKTIADSLNLYGVGDDGIVFNIEGDTTFEESGIVFEASGTSENPVIITWNGEGDKPVIQFSASDANDEAGITLLGVDFYFLDGIVITNPDSNLETGIFITNADEENGAHHNMIKNIEIILDKLNEHPTTGILVSPTVTPTVIDGNNNYNTFLNNHISNVTIGYNIDGNTSNTFLMGVGNEIGTLGEGTSELHDLVMAGVLAKDQNGFTLRNTAIYDLTRIDDGTNTAPAAISTQSGNPSDPLFNEFIIENNTIEGLTSNTTSIYGMYISARKATYHINNNKIHDVTATGGGGNTADGIMILATDVEANIYNNMVSGIAAPGSALNGNAVTRGICVRTYGLANVFYNTVLLDYEATHLSHHSAAFIIFNNSSSNFAQMRNNIFINKTTLPQDADGIVAAVYKRNNNTINILPETDNNIYYAGEPSENHLIYYGHNSSAPAAMQTLEDYKAFAEDFDQNSLTEDVEFIAEDDLHIVAWSGSVAKNNAVPITDPFNITVDFDGTTRDSSTPDIGADEIASELPTTAINPTPENGATEVALDINELSWEFHTTPEYSTPYIFQVFLEETPDFNGAIAIGSVNYVEGQIDYTLTMDDLEPSTTYYWQVAPLVNPDNPANMLPDMETWSFTTAPYPYPNAAVNPVPADGTTYYLVEANENTPLGWEYFPDPNYTVPTHFKVYASTDTESDNWQTPIAQVDYVEGQTAYEEWVTTFTGAFMHDEITYWKVVPENDNGATPDEEVSIWMCPVIQVGLTEAQIENTLIYPNPARDFININPGFDGNYEIRIYDIQGKLVKNYGLGEGDRTLNTNGLPAGNYQMVITQGQDRFSKPITLD